LAVAEAQVNTWQQVSDIPSDLAETAVTIGKFDAIHLGHRSLLAELLDVAEDSMLAPVVLSFANHPNAVLSPSNVPLPVIGPNQRAFLLEEAGVEGVLSLEFDAELAGLSAEAFVTRYLVEGLKARAVIVGRGFRFGAGGAGTVETLRELGAKHGFTVREVAPVLLDGTVVSTTLVRNALDAGDVVLASEMLGRNHTTMGHIEHGLKIGRQIGFPTANMARSAEGYLPLDGVYAGWLYAGIERYPAALSVGVNATFQEVPRLIEAHILDRDDVDLYDKLVTLEYVDFIRPSAKFDGVESLVAEINRDLEKIRQRLDI
jgi:riboflavin kinase/FMN adenylyltransferase